MNRSGQRIDVPACGPASAAQFDMSYVDVRTERGYWYKFASPGPPADAPRTQYLVLVAGGETLPGTTYDRPGPLPGCDGRPDVQPGV